MKLTSIVALTLFAAISTPAAEGLPKVRLQPAWTNVAVERPLTLCESPDGTGRVFLMEQRGRILILPTDRGASNAGVFLDITARRPLVDNEEGLLGMAFHPEFKTNGKVFVHYTQQNPRRGVVSEFTVAKGDAGRLDPATERVVLEVPQPYGNHNGGTTIFGPDGKLFIGLGDGGSLRDPHLFAQNMATWLGKILRIDVDARDAGLGYAVPKDNPFAGKAGVRGEIWSSGWRNPWRMSFDRETGELYVADVGQDKWEEVCVVRKGANHGWSVREGFHEFKTNQAVAAGVAFADPILEYPHNPALDTNNPVGPGLSITGGFVYRGKKNPGLRGVYVFADFAVGTIWGLRYAGGEVTARGTLVPFPKGTVPIRSVAGFGEDGAGEVYVLTFEGQPKGRIYEFAEVKE